MQYYKNAWLLMYVIEARTLISKASLGGDKIGNSDLEFPYIFIWLMGPKGHLGIRNELFQILRHT